jgi:ArsR family transcriptional regulator
MEVNVATRGFGALAQGTRLEAFRLLVRCGARGMAAGEIARAINVPQNTMSSHLATLVNAGLLESRREGRSIIYAVHLDGTQALLTFLLEDCCQGQPEACISLLNAVLPGCCPAGSA